MVEAAAADRPLKAVDWATLPDDKLLEMRMCDLGLNNRGHRARSAYRDVIAEELHARGLKFRPRYWLSDEWFTPDGVPGVAIPFYLAHPRLAKLELAQMLEVEGGDEVSCLRILRHEVGHALDNAYELRRRPTRRRLFGNPSRPSIPSTTRPSPTARASSSISTTGMRRAIPTKTSPRRSPSGSIRSRIGRTHYGGWPARRKLEYMDRLMRELAQRRPSVKSKRVVDPLPRLRKTLGEHYQEKSASTTASIIPTSTIAICGTCFRTRRLTSRSLLPTKFVSKIRREARATVASFTDSYQYTIDQLITRIIARCRDLNLHLMDTEKATKADFMVFLTVQTMNYLHSGRHRVAL